MKRILTITCFLISLCSASFAQDSKLIVEISNDTLLMGNYIQVKYTLENGQGQFEMPEIDGLRIISGPNTSSSMSVINGEVKQSSSYAIYLEPIDIGVGYIGPIYITNDEGTLESQPINLVILDNPDGTLIDPNKLKFVEEVVLTADGKLKRKKKKIKRYKI